MRDQHQGGLALDVALEHQLDDFGAGRLVEIAGRLVGDEDRRIGHQRTRECDALLLTAGQLCRIVVAALRKADCRELTRGALLRIGCADELKRHSDILERRHGGNEVERLKHNADIAAAKPSQRILIERTERLIRHHDRAGVGSFEAGHDHQQGRFPRAGRANHANRLAPPYIELDVFENMDTRGAPTERQIDARKRDRGGRALQSGGVVHGLVPSLSGRSTVPLIWGLGGLGPDGHCGHDRGRISGRCRARGRCADQDRGLG